MKNRGDNYYFDYLIKAKIPQAKNILTNKKDYKDLTIYLTKCDQGKLMKMLSLYYYKLKRKTEQHERKKCLMVDDVY